MDLHFIQVGIEYSYYIKQQKLKISVSPSEALGSLIHWIRIDSMPKSMEIANGLLECTNV